MNQLYGYYLKTGSGTTMVSLLFTDPEAAIIEIDASWMSSGSKQYRLHFDHEAVTDTYGFLSLRAAEHYDQPRTGRAVARDISRFIAPFRHSNDDVDENTDDEALYPVPYRYLTFAYIRLSTPQPWIADEPSLEEMRQWFNLAQWPPTFDLFLWRHFGPAVSKMELQDDEITSILQLIDKMKFTSTLDEGFARAVTFPPRETNRRTRAG